MAWATIARDRGERGPGLRTRRAPRKIGSPAPSLHRHLFPHAPAPVELCESATLTLEHKSFGNPKARLGSPRSRASTVQPVE